MYKNRNSRKRKKQHYCENIVTQPLIKGDKPFDTPDSQIHRIYSPLNLRFHSFGVWIGLDLHFRQKLFTQPLIKVGQ